MAPEIQDFIPGPFAETGKYIEDVYENFFTVRQTVEVQIKMCDDNGKSFITTLFNVILAPDL